MIACAKDNAQTRPDYLVVAYRSIVQSLDPITENTQISNSIYGNIYEPLVIRNIDSTIVPCLAKEWLNPGDDRGWIFQLRRDAVFHDGTPVQAKDVVYSLERAGNDPASTLATALLMVEKVQAIDEFTVRVVTRKPYPVLLNRLADVWIVPKGSTASAAKTIPGTGPYSVTKWQEGSYIEMKAVDRYWGKKPVVQRVRFESMPDVNMRSKDLLSGRVAILPILEPVAVTSLANHTDLTIHSTPGLMVLYLGMDVARDKTPYVQQSGNPFLDIRVRRAFRHAINVRHLIQQVLQGNATQTTQLLAPSVYGFNRSIRNLPYDPEKAMQLLREAGYPDGFTVRFDHTNNRYHNDVGIARSIAADLQKIRIQVQLNPMEKDDLYRLRREKDTSFYMTGWRVDSRDASGALDYVIHSRDEERGFGSENTIGYENRQVDELIELAATTMDPKERAKLMEAAMALAMEDCAFIPLYVENQVTVTRADIALNESVETLFIKNLTRIE